MLLLLYLRDTWKSTSSHLVSLSMYAMVAYIVGNGTISSLLLTDYYENTRRPHMRRGRQVNDDWN